MKIVILSQREKYESDFSYIGYFSSKEKAEKYRDKYVKNYPAFKDDEFFITTEEIDPDGSWMEE